jgi:molybdopterin-guanine dinucleotide biosynthesis protein A
MGGTDKGLLECNGATLVELVLRRLAPQVERSVISANRNLDRYQSFGLPVIEDLLGGMLGPLAGMHATLAMLHDKVELVLFVPCDAPDLACDLAQRLAEGLDTMSGARASYARAGGRSHPAFCLLHASLKDDLEHYLARGERRLESFLVAVGAVSVDFEDKVEHFANLNTPEDLAHYLHQHPLHEP